MRPRVVVTLAVSLFILVLVFVRADLFSRSTQPQASPAAADAEVRAFMRSWDEAYLAQSTSALARLLAEDFTLVDASGRSIGRDEYVISAAKAPARPPESDASEIVSVRIYGDTAVVIGRSRTKGVPRGRMQLLGTDIIFTDVLIRKGGTWQAVATHATAIAK
jgi:ketosteroid isomerase-like protein